MVPPRPSRSGRSGPGRAVLAIVAAVQAVVLGAAVAQQRSPESDAASSTLAGPAATAAPAAPARPRTAPLLAEPTGQTGPERTQAVEQLLHARGRAVLRRDRAAFLAVVDPAAPALRARQAAAFDALAQVPLSSWDYVLDPATAERSAALDRRYGEGAWWAPGVVLRYAIAGVDQRPVEVEHHLSFVRRAGRWRLAADDDFAPAGRATPRALWDRGPVVAVRDAGVLVLGHPGQDDLLHDVARLAADAVPRVSDFWGPWSGHVVLVVPDDAAELAEPAGLRRRRVAAGRRGHGRAARRARRVRPDRQPSPGQPRGLRRPRPARPPGRPDPRAGARRDARRERSGGAGLARGRSCRRRRLPRPRTCRGRSPPPTCSGRCAPAGCR